MRFLANENVSKTVVHTLRERGHDVLSVKESMRGEADVGILARAQQETRLLITHDKDFGELAFRGRLPAECGIILLRLNGDDSESDSHRAVAVIDGRSDWAGNFSVITDERIRMRPLPGAPRQPDPEAN